MSPLIRIPERVCESILLTALLFYFLGRRKKGWNYLYLII